MQLTKDLENRVADMYWSGMTIRGIAQRLSRAEGISYDEANVIIQKLLYKILHGEDES